MDAPCSILNNDFLLDERDEIEYIIIYLLSGLTPESLWMWLISRRDPVIVGPGPEPPVHIDRLEVSSVTTLVLEITLSATGVD